MFLIILGGLGFMVLKEIITKRRVITLHSKVVIRVTILLLLAGTLLILLLSGIIRILLEC